MLLKYIEPFAERLELDPVERTDFILYAHLTRSPKLIQDRFEVLEYENKRLIRERESNRVMITRLQLTISRLENGK